MNLTKLTATYLLLGVLFAYVSAVLTAPSLWSTGSCVLIGAAVGNSRWLAVRRRAVARRAMRSQAEPTPLLSTTEFAQRCAKLLKPTGEPEPDLPEAIPEGLRDPGFAASRERNRTAEATLKASPKYDERRARIRELALSSYGVWGFGGLEVNLDASDRATVAALPLLTDRAFVALTHCPEGHIGDHWVGQAGEVDGVATIHRTCRFTRCSATWQERAWTS